MENRPGGAIPQRDGTSYAIMPRTPAGIVSPEALDLVRRLLEYYRENARKWERTARFVERVGFDAVGKDILTFAPYISLDSARSG